MHGSQLPSQGTRGRAPVIGTGPSALEHANASAATRHRIEGVVLGRPWTLPDNVVERIVRARRAGSIWTAIADGSGGTPHRPRIRCCQSR
jgi:hypothetical protein